MDNFIAAFILMLGLNFIAQFINSKALKKLDDEKKLLLIDLFAASRINTFAVLFGIIVLFLLNLKFQLINPRVSLLIYLFLLITFIIVTSSMAYKKLKANAFSDDFIRSYILSTSVRFLGLIFFLLLM
jgi:heme/copper-type cytochrome/quinol oxidase subunit 3